MSMANIVNSINRGTSTILTAYQLKTQREKAALEAKRNALADMLTAAKLDEYQRGVQTRENTRNALAIPWENPANAGRAVIQNQGDMETGLELLKQGQPSYELTETDQGLVYLPTVPGRGDPVPSGYQQPPKKELVKNVIGGGSEDPVAEQIFGELPERRQEALRSAAQARRLNNIFSILNKQGDKVTGLSGALRRGLAPFASMAGLNADAMSDAELFNSLIKEGQGSMRMEVIGPGPVSEYEQKILADVSGGGMSYAEGVRALLQRRYMDAAQQIKAYNSTIETIAGDPKYKSATTYYPRIKVPDMVAGAPGTRPQDTATTDDTIDWDAMPDEQLIEIMNSYGIPYNVR